MDWKTLQTEQGEWETANFGLQPAWRPLMGMGEEIGEAMHCCLKMDQGIRGTKDQHIENLKDALGDVMIYMFGFLNRSGNDIMEVLDLYLEPEDLSTRYQDPVREYLFRANTQYGMLCARYGALIYPLPSIMTFTEEKYLALMMSSLAGVAKQLIAPRGIESANFYLLAQTKYTWDGVVKKRDWKKNAHSGV